MDLTTIARPWTDDDGEITNEWAQIAFYRRPVIATRIEELIGRVSLFTVGGSTVLRLWDPQYDTFDVRDALAGPKLPSPTFTVALSPVSRTPVETGYLECMRLSPASDGVAAEDAIAAFTALQLERYLDMEQHLVDIYGDLTAEQDNDGRFGGIDYPAFDLGAVKLGLGLFAQHARHRHAAIWCWSRVVNWHK